MSFTVYQSSAGSGKTFTLVREYLKIVLAEPGDFRQVLAITFTNKAANEMKERVLKALSDLSAQEWQPGGGISAMAEKLLQDTGLTEEELRRNAAIALEMILHNYADFAIGTIDSFSHRLIRSFAHDFGLPVNFDVELEADELLARAIDLFLERVGEDRALTDVLVQFLESRMEEDRGTNIDRILLDFARNLLDEEGQARIASLRHLSLDDFGRIAGMVRTSVRQFEKTVRDLGREGLSLLKDSGLTASDLYHADRGVWGYFAGIAAGRMDKMEPNSYVKTTFEEDKWHSAKVTRQAMEIIGSLKPALSDIYERLGREIASGGDDYHLRRMLLKTIYPLAVLNEIEGVLVDFKRRNNLVHISEFNSRIASVVMNEPVPFIYERLGEKYRHILIDEFQDTSSLQWLNFIPLIENSLAGGNFNMVVGDGKQAIYRWRGGDVEQFAALPAIPGSAGNPVLADRERMLRDHFRKLSLERNFRSEKEIVEFNNRFFRVLAGKVLGGGWEKIYQDLEQQCEREERLGYITIEFIAGNEETDYIQATLDRVSSVISEALDDGFDLQDIAILCRSNIEASMTAAFLLDQGLNVVSAESLLVRNSAGVRFIVACMKSLYEPANDIVDAEIRSFLQQESSCSGCAGPDRETLMLLPVYDLCESLIRDYRLDPATDPYLRFFLDAVLKVRLKTPAGVTDFLEWWENNRNKLSIVVPEELNAIRVMTIHKAKGLEFPMVILPFADESRSNTRRWLWVDVEPQIAPGLGQALLPSEQELESTVYRDLFSEERRKSMVDMLNLLYVAMTRPAERLTILTSIPPAEKDELKCLAAFFRFFLQAENLWDEKRPVYEFGKRTAHTRRQGRSRTEPVQMDSVVSSDWRKRIGIRRSAPGRWDPAEPVKRPKRGNLLHELLSRIVTAEEVGFVTGQACLDGILLVDEMPELSGILSSVVSHPALQRLFSGEVRVRTEAEILLPGGTFYRPDRVVFDGGILTILDYKTGKPNPGHREQLEKYAGSLREMGHREIRRLLVYLEPEINVVEV